MGSPLGVTGRLLTDRCVLRKPLPQDVPVIHKELSGDPLVTRYLGWKTHATERETRDQITYDIHRWIRGAGWTWVVEYELAPVGLIQVLPQGHQARLGFLMARRVWGRGLASEALETVVDSVLDMPAIHRLDAVCDIDNGASAHVLEKIGMQREGCLQRYCVHPNVSELPRDVWMYARIKP